MWKVAAALGYCIRHASLLAKLELLAHYLGDEAPAERGNPQLVLLAGVRAGVLSMREQDLPPR